MNLVPHDLGTNFAPKYWLSLLYSYAYECTDNFLLISSEPWADLYWLQDFGGKGEFGDGANDPEDPYYPLPAHFINMDDFSWSVQHYFGFSNAFCFDKKG